MSAGNWNDCIAFTLREEGGLVDRLGDSGGLTNFGISQAAYPHLDIAGLTPEGAAAIYWRDYWERVAGSDLPLGVDLMVFDMAVNAGVAQSGMILQRCVGATPDGVIGGATMAAVADTAPTSLVVALGAAQLAFYESLSGWAEFGAGWSARCARRSAEARAMAANVEEAA